MSLYKGTTPIAGLAVNKIMAGRFLLEAIWSDHIINDIQYLRADTFSWQSGIVYTAACNKLVEEYTSGTEETKDGITFRRSENGFKIADASQENAIASKYTDTGVAWYYILDTENKQFKLPRTKFNFVGLRDTAGDYVSESLPNIKGNFNTSDAWGGTGAFTVTGSQGYDPASTRRNYTGVQIDASKSSSTYQDGAPVQQRATQMYLYFFVGNFSQTAIEQTAGVATEALNDMNAKIDGEVVHVNNPLLRDYSLAADSNIQVDLSSALPNDNEVYECRFEYQTACDYNKTAFIYQQSDLELKSAAMWRGRSFSTTASMQGGGTFITYVGNQRYIKLFSTVASGGACNIVLFLRSYRKVGK